MALIHRRIGGVDGARTRDLRRDSVSRAYSEFSPRIQAASRNQENTTEFRVESLPGNSLVACRRPRSPFEAAPLMHPRQFAQGCASFSRPSLRACFSGDSHAGIYHFNRASASHAKRTAETTHGLPRPKVPGFVLRARPSGVHSWRVQLPNRHWLTLGRVDEVPLAAAREEAQQRPLQPTNFLAPRSAQSGITRQVLDR
jgi:hypothetical protein